MIGDLEGLTISPPFAGCHSTSGRFPQLKQAYEHHLGEEQGLSAEYRACETAVIRWSQSLAEVAGSLGSLRVGGEQGRDSGEQPVHDHPEAEPKGAA